MNAQDTIGQLIDEHAQRDAVHIALSPMIAGCKLYPGEKVVLAHGGTDTVISDRDPYWTNGQARKVIGIVDPFLTVEQVEKGERCWVFLLPGTVTGMRHEWKHPDLDTLAPMISESEAWLRRFADQWNFDYDQLINEASAVSEGEWGRYMSPAALTYIIVAISALMRLSSGSISASLQGSTLTKSIVRISGGAAHVKGSPFVACKAARRRLCKRRASSFQ